MSSQILSPQDVATESEDPLFPAGTYMESWDGREWVYVQTLEALVQGNAVESGSYAHITGTVETAAAADTRRIHDTGVFTTTALADMAPTVQNGHTYKLWVRGGASQGQGGIIYNRVDDDYVDVYFINSDDGKIATALTTASAFTCYTLTRVKKTNTAHADRIVGFVQRQGGITDEYWFWALVKGEGVALFDTDQTTQTAGAPIVSAALGGAIEGANTTQTAEAFYTAGYGLMDVTADALCPIVANCIKIAGIQMPSSLTAAYPAMR